MVQHHLTSGVPAQACARALTAHADPRSRRRPNTLAAPVRRLVSAGDQPGSAGPVRCAQLTNIELQPVVSPDGLVKVDGTTFGAERGNGGLRLEWTAILVQNDFTKQSRLCLNVIDWSDTRVIARAPREVVGAPHQNAPVVLRTDRVAYSNTLPLQFVRTRETVNLGSVPVNVQISCSDGSSRDSCDANGGRRFDYV